MLKTTGRSTGRQVSFLLAGVFALNFTCEQVSLSQPVPKSSLTGLRRAPAFTLKDDAGRGRSLAKFRGHPVVLFFFCGCSWCTQCAEVWGQMQWGGVLTSSSTSPLTLVVFSGDASAAQAFAAQTGLDLSRTVLLPDPTMRVTDAYKADPCPRAFVLDAQGRVSYTNDHADDSARQASAVTIASRTLDALRACSSAAPNPAKPLPKHAARQDASLHAVTPPPTMPVPAPGAKASLPATDLNGRLIDLAARPGWKVIYFWSAECPCVRACERYSYLPLAKRHGGKVSFYAVASGKFDMTKPRGELRQLVQAHHLPFPVLLDPGHRLADTFGAKATPQTYLLDPQNRVVFSGMPDDSRQYLGDLKQGVFKAYLAQALSEALAGRKVTDPKVKDAGCVIDR